MQFAFIRADGVRTKKNSLLDRWILFLDFFFEKEFFILFFILFFQNRSGTLDVNEIHRALHEGFYLSLFFLFLSSFVAFPTRQ